MNTDHPEIIAAWGFEQLARTGTTGPGVKKSAKLPRIVRNGRHNIWRRSVFIPVLARRRDVWCRMETAPIRRLSSCADGQFDEPLSINVSRSRSAPTVRRVHASGGVSSQGWRASHESTNRASTVPVGSARFPSAAFGPLLPPPCIRQRPFLIAGPRQVVWHRIPSPPPCDAPLQLIAH
jgi:hypothetical protein